MEQPAALLQPSMAKAAGAFCILLLLTVLCSQSLAQRAPAVPDKCCFNFHTRKIKMNNIVACYATSPQCQHQAVIFRVKNGKEICTPAEKMWVKRYQQRFQVSSYSIPS